jgi:L-asparaginase/Glu-tRNA(Gln) amidotransferase subunit D
MKYCLNSLFEELIWVIENSLPSEETIKILDTNRNDNTVIIRWRDNGYAVTGCYADQQEAQQYIAVGKITSNRFSDDNAHILLEMILNKTLQQSKNIHSTKPHILSLNEAI